jgi:hypothetical protein
MQNLNAVQAGLEMAVVSSILLTFSHVVSNGIQSHPIVQIIEQPSFKFHQGQNKT